MLIYYFIAGIFLLCSIPIIALLDYYIFKFENRCPHCNRNLTHKWTFLIATTLEIGCFIGGAFVGISIGLMLFGGD